MFGGETLYLAKSNPKETLEEHTLELLNKFEKLRALYPDIMVDWELLRDAIVYHDMGKINDVFQNKLQAAVSGKEYFSDENEIPHGYLSILFIDYNNITDSGYRNKNICDYVSLRKKILIASVYFHHVRGEIGEDIGTIKERLSKEKETLEHKELNFKTPELQKIRVRKIPSQRFFCFDLSRIIPADLCYDERKESYIEYCKIKGLLNKIDYAASAHEEIEFPSNFIEAHLEKMLKKLQVKNPRIHWNKLQLYMKAHQNRNIIAVAQTGMGKTEAGLLWIGNNKGFFTLPLKTAINSIYERIIQNIDCGLSEKVGLLHSDIAAQYLKLLNENDFSNDAFELDEYIYNTRQLSIPLTICTIDQIFDFCYKYAGSEIKLATLAYSKIIIDEIQMYDPGLLAVIIVALEWIVAAGGSFAILTATMPPFLIDEFSALKIPFELPDPFINDDVRHSIKTFDKNIDSEFVKSLFSDNKVLVICNTVKEAQRIYHELVEDETFIGLVRIFHSSFIKKDRRRIESDILTFTEKGNTEKGIWICTQVVEASLDIDFDILITELSDINGLFQRMGRCYRKRIFENEGYNCFVFLGNDILKPSGVGTVVDDEIFKLSVEAIKEIDGKVNESKKQELINRIYTSSNLRNSKFYSRYVLAKDSLRVIEPGDYTKKEVNRIFRNINSVEVIPKVIYGEFEEEIKAKINKLRNRNFCNEPKYERLKIKQELEDFTVDIPLFIFQKIKSVDMRVTPNWSIHIADIEYDEYVGVNRMKAKDNTAEDIFARMI